VVNIIPSSLTANRLGSHVSRAYSLCIWVAKLYFCRNISTNKIQEEQPTKILGEQDMMSLNRIAVVCLDQ